MLFVAMITYLANKSPFRADILSHRIEEIVPDDLMPAPDS